MQEKVDDPARQSTVPSLGFSRQEASEDRAASVDP